MSLNRTAGVSLLLSLILSSTLWAQSGTTGTLNGVVRDSTGGVLPGVSIAVNNVDTGLNRTVITDTEGRWAMAVLPVGPDHQRDRRRESHDSTEKRIPFPI